MPLSLKPQHLKRYRDVAGLLLAHGELAASTNRDLTEEMLERDRAGQTDDQAKAEALADQLEALGPTFVKLGQMLSGRPDLVPPTYLQALSRLQDDVEPFPGEQAEAIFTDEIGLPPSRCFAEFDRRPLAAASLGQVHAARLTDGREVVVKIQRPGIRAQVIHDLDAFAEIAANLEQHAAAARRLALGDMLAESRKTLLRELDYVQEANNLERLAGQLRHYKRLLVPQPLRDFCSGRVLTMTRIPGVKVTAMADVARTEIDTRRLAQDLFKAYLDQVLVDGFFHADPHAGNVLVTPDGRLGLIDLGMTGTFDPQRQEQLLRLLLKLAEGEGRSAANAVIDISEPLEDFDRNAYLRDAGAMINRHAQVPDSRIQNGRIVLELLRIGSQHRLRPAPELAILGKTLLHLDEVGQVLHPGFDSTDTLRKHAAELIRRRSLAAASPGRMLATAVETQGFLQDLPERLNKIMDAVVESRLTMNVRAFDEAQMMANLQRIANRIATGLVLAALIIGAALMMNIDAGPRLFGYPALSLVMFLLAAVTGFGMVFQALRRDHQYRHNKPPD